MSVLISQPIKTPIKPATPAPMISPMKLPRIVPTMKEINIPHVWFKTKTQIAPSIAPKNGIILLANRE